MSLESNELDGRMDEAARLTEDKFAELSQQIRLIQSFVERSRKDKETMRLEHQRELNDIEMMVNKRFEREI